MLEKLYQNNPLGLLMLCASIVGGAYVISYRLDSVEKVVDKNTTAITTATNKINDVDRSISREINKMRSDMNSGLADLDLRVSLLEYDQRKREGDDVRN
jgi:hypothetical protein